MKKIIIIFIILVGYKLSFGSEITKTVKSDIKNVTVFLTNKQIEVNDLEYPEADYNLETGLLKWNIKLEPKENKKIDFKYEVKLPKNKTLK